MSVVDNKLPLKVFWNDKYTKNNDQTAFFERVHVFDPVDLGQI